MKKQTVNITLLSLLLITTSPLIIAQESLESLSLRVAKNKVSNEKHDKLSKGKKISSIDGTTSASKLRAIRSHSGAKENETKLTVFLGLFAIAIIVFFLRVLGNKK
jgi:hypothetical protein